MPFCTQCGHENAAGSRFCAACGAPMHAGAALTDETTTITLDPDVVDTGSLRVVDPELPGQEQDAVEALPPGSALMIVQRGPSSGSRFLLDTDTVSAGRHPESEIFLDDVTVSRRHADFIRTTGGYSVRDVGSLNGTYVNRDRIEEVALTSGDEVQIGKFRLVYYASLRGFLPTSGMPGTDGAQAVQRETAPAEPASAGTNGEAEHAEGERRAGGQ